MFKAITFKLNPFKTECIEILSAMLDFYDYDGICEFEEEIVAYVQKDKLSVTILSDIQLKLHELGCGITWEEKDIPEKNWNEIWESNFEPITIQDQCVIRAPFHQEYGNYRYQIIIEPKMSFGTGHHQTTRLMIENMLGMNFKDKAVLDMGCGTGVLSILAGFKEASRVVAVDIDKWAYENALENVLRNKVEQVRVMQGDTQVVLNERFDFLLANINRNILLEQIIVYSIILKPEGILLLSGILSTDCNAIRKAAERNNFSFMKSSELDEWTAIMFKRN